VNPSDEVTEAVACALYEYGHRERGWLWANVHPLARQKWLDRARVALDAARPAERAEAVADERRRIRNELHELAQLLPVEEAQRTSTWLAAAFTTSTLAAGSVPVATPEPTKTERHDAFYRGEPDGRHDLELGCAPDCPCSNPRPVATPPAEPADEVHDSNCEQQFGACCCHCQKRADVACSHAAAPSQPVTCEHGKPGRHPLEREPMDAFWNETRWCPGPVSVPKESSE
jgi:hypothetical protein